MEHIQHIVLDSGGTVSLELPTRPTSVKVTISTGDGSAIVTNATANIATVNTTLGNAVVAGATAFDATNAANCAVNTEILVGNPPEKVLIRAITANAVTTWHPFLYDHANASAVQSTQAFYAVNAASANTLFFDGRAVWTVDNTTYVTACECTKWPLRNLCTEQDVFAEDASIRRSLNSEHSVRLGLSVAFRDLLAALGGHGRVNVYTGSHEFNRAIVFKFLENHWRKYDAEKSARYGEAFRGELELIAAQIPRDDNMDGEITAEEQIHVGNIEINRR